RATWNREPSSSSVGPASTGAAATSKTTGIASYGLAIARALKASGVDSLVRAAVSFSHTDSLLVFDRVDLMQPLDAACPELAQVNDAIVLSYIARLDKDDVITRVTQKIIELLPDGKCNCDRVASALCMSRATLHSRLT